MAAWANKGEADPEQNAQERGCFPDQLYRSLGQNGVVNVGDRTDIAVHF